MEVAEALSLEDCIRAIKAAHSPSPEVNFYDNALGIDLVHAHLEVPGCVGRGFGSGRSAHEALIKAYSEWIERTVFHSISAARGPHSTNGMAAHPNEATAIENATLELIERDAFLTSWLAGSPPRWLSMEEVSAVDRSGFLQTQVELFAVNHFALRLGVIGVTGNAVTAVTAMVAQDPLPIAGGAAIQTRSARSLVTALNGAVQTQRTAATVVLNRQKREFPPLQISSRELSQPRDLLAFYLNRENAVDLDWYVGAAAEAVDFPVCRINVELFSPCSAWPLTVARASSPEMQDYFACEIPRERINWERLRAVYPDAIAINERMHPLS